MSGRVDWSGLMRLGLGRLRLTPETFWAMSPREFAAVLEATSGPAPAARPELAALMAAYPDAVKEDRA